jgi:hypothetical protein
MPTREQLEAKFRRLGIDFANPGFYDSAEFRAVEHGDPTFLNSYAQYVQRLTLPPEYLERARTVVRNTAEFLYHELVADGRRGACVDISSAMLRFLERQGIWCHVVCGGLRVEFPAGSRIRPKWFYPLMRNNHTFTGHAWIYAPPFRLVDLSVSLQPYPPEQQRYLSGYTMVEQCHQPPTQTTIRDLMENELVEDFVRDNRRMPTMDDLTPALREFMREFPRTNLSETTFASHTRL